MDSGAEPTSSMEWLALTFGTGLVVQNNRLPRADCIQNEVLLNRRRELVVTMFQLKWYNEVGVVWLESKMRIAGAFCHSEMKVNE
jgi:hypothetical protein